MALIAYDPPDRFVVGAVGDDDDREFYLQVKGGERATCVIIEESQVSLLTDRMHDMLDRFAGGAASDHLAAGFADSGPLDMPFEVEFRVGTMSLTWDPATARMIVECHDLTPADLEDDDDDHESDGPDPADDPTRQVLRVTLPPAAARAFASRGRSVLLGDRLPCPFCAGAVSSAGHICPRANGYRRSELSPRWIHGTQ